MAKEALKLLSKISVLIVEDDDIARGFRKRAKALLQGGIYRK